MSGLDRRRFLQVTASALALPACAALVSTPVTPVAGRIALALDRYPQLTEPGGYLKLRLPEGGVLYVVHLASDQYAVLSPICTHLGCTVDIGATGLLCPCHGSLYDREGRVVHGPAMQPLRRYPAAVTPEGRLVVELEGA
jgi:Rieske Fe-S protein